jgi:hypothetical protein
MEAISPTLSRHATKVCSIGSWSFSKSDVTLVLRLQPSDEDALKTKLFLLLQTEQYDAALSLLDENKSFEHPFERAYSLYRLHREPESKDILQAIKAEGSDDRGPLHLEAQLVRGFLPSSHPAINVTHAELQGRDVSRSLRPIQSAPGLCRTSTYPAQSLTIILISRMDFI